MRVSFKTRLVLVPLFSFLAFGATSPAKWELIERYGSVSVGDWVKLKYSGGSEHLLLVAAKDDRTVTVEEKVREEGYTTSWTQVVIDLEKRAPVVVREKVLLTGEIRETKIGDEEWNLDDEFKALLTAQFWEEPGTERVSVPAGRFSCKEYRAVYNKKVIKIFFSSKIPLYPVMVLVPYYSLSIKLVDFGKGMESNFFPKGSGSAGTGSGKSASEGPCAGSAGRPQ